ncbi:unnamed protein product, partial [Closterium sp. Naga37s-1]
VVMALLLVVLARATPSQTLRSDLSGFHSHSQGVQRAHAQQRGSAAAAITAAGSI